MTETPSVPQAARWIVPALTVLVTSGATTLFFLVYSDVDTAVLDALFVVIFGVGFVLALANVVQAVVVGVSKRAGYLAFCRRVMLLVKLGLVPFYLAGAAILVFFSLVSFFPFGFVVSLAAYGFLVPFGWIVMACCSAWTFVYAVGLWRAGLLSSGACVISCILSLFFVCDVVCAVVLFVHGRKSERVLAGASQNERIA